MTSERTGTAWTESCPNPQGYYLCVPYVACGTLDLLADSNPKDLQLTTAATELTAQGGYPDKSVAY